MKQNKNYWKKISREFNEHAERDDGWKNERAIKVSHTSLFPVHSGGRGPNPGEPTLLEFGTRLLSCSGIYFHFESKYGSLEIYTRSQTGGHSKVFFEVRKGNKNWDFTWIKRANPDDQHGWLIKEILVKAEAQGGRPYNTEDMREFLVSLGYSIVAEFEYTEKIQFRLPHHGGGFIRPTYVKAIKNGLEIGWISSGTYNSLPQVLKIEKIKRIRTVKLADLGIERKGYYSHYYHYEIQATQAKAAKAFFGKRFKKVD